MRKTLCFLLMLLPALMTAEEARLLRFPSVGGDKIAFTYAGDLYTVPVNGGHATKITSHIGYETFSRFSPDGKTIAFTGQYDGNTEVYLIPAEGGTPQRLTYTATLDRDDIGDRMGPNNIVMCWTPDGKDVVFRTRWYTFSGLRGLLYHAPVDGSDLKQIPTTEGGFCSYSPDGKKLALNRMFREFRTWKYYRGGQADDIWINTVGTTELVNVTNNPAQDIFPMWVGEEIYFMSDRDHTMNLFCYNTATGQTRKVTDFKE
ncbi:MAG: PD40 domain-containing protein, partial [Bacteroidales bacterium]|nr:PD40 domain-containing protein [Bacteroidales bacterium]